METRKVVKRPDLIICNKSLKQRLAVSKFRTGMRLSTATKEKMSKILLGSKRHLGKPHTEATKRQLREKAIALGFVGKNHPNWKGGLPKCIDCGIELSAYGYIRCKNCAVEELKRNPRMIGFKHSRETKDLLRTKTVRQLQTGMLKQDTSIELKMKGVLDKNKIEYKHPYNFKDKFLCDFAIPDRRVIIECDGDYWHNREDTRKRDKSKNGYIRKCGWTLLRFWEHEINDNIDECFDTVQEAIVAF